MEGDFEQANLQGNQLTRMLSTYEQTVTGQFGTGQAPVLNAAGVLVPMSEVEVNGQPSNDANESSFMVFDQLQSSMAGNDKLDDWDKLTERMQNPFTIMRRWLKFEILDLEAMLEAVEKGSEMEKRKIAKNKQRNSDMEEVRQMKDGRDTIKSFFRSKEGKINKITMLSEAIQRADRDIECLDLLYKIVVL